MFQVVSNRYYNNIAIKLNNPKLSAQTYWSVLEIFYNGKKDCCHSSTFNKQ